VDTNLDVGFNRNRRFLIAVSLGLACAHYLNLTIDKVSILGNEAVVKNEDRVEMLVIAVWIWAWVKYCLWFHDVGAWGEIANKAQMRLQDRLQEWGRDQQMPVEVRDWLVTDADSQTNGSDWQQRDHRFMVNVRGVSGDPFGHAITVIHLTGTLLRTTDQINSYTSRDREYTLSLDSDIYRSFRRRAFAHTLFTRRYFVEYLAPFIIGAAPLFAWSGSAYSWIVDQLKC